MWVLPIKEYSFDDPASVVERQVQSRLRNLMQEAASAGVSKDARISMLKIALRDEGAIFDGAAYREKASFFNADGPEK